MRRKSFNQSGFHIHMHVGAWFYLHFGSEAISIAFHLQLNKYQTSYIKLCHIISYGDVDNWNHNITFVLLFFHADEDHQ